MVVALWWVEMQAMQFLRKEPCPNCGGQITALNKASKTVGCFVDFSPAPPYANLPCRQRVQYAHVTDHTVAAASGVGKAMFAKKAKFRSLSEMP
jgi:hypothetical protein